MADAARKNPIPRTAEQLDADVKRLERALSDTERARDTARTRLASLIDQGDTDGLAEARADRDLCEARIPDISRALKAAREDAEAAQHRARRASAAQGYEDIRKAVAQQAGRAAKLEDCVDALGEALMEFREGMDAAEATMRSAGVQPDPYHLRTLYAGILDIRLHIATSGLYGRMRTLESKHQIEQAGRDSLRQLAAQYEALSLQRARAALRVSGQQTEVA
jgi:hypothetical protein